MARSSFGWLALPFAAFALVALSLGFLAKAAAPEPGSYPSGFFRLFFTDTVHLKAWFATVAVALGLLQLFSAGWIYGKIPWRRPAWVQPAHRWSGRIALLLTLPVAYHCIFKLGFQSVDNRALWHSLLGCAFFGAFAAKVTIVRSDRLPGAALPIAGGLLFASLVAVWYTSAIWFFRAAGWEI